MKLTVREQNLITIAVTFLVCVLISTYLILPLRTQYLEARTKLNDATQRLAENRSAQKQARSSEKELKVKRGQLAAFRQQLPMKSESSELLFYLNQAAVKSGVALERFECLELKNSEDDGTASSGKSIKDGEKKSGSIMVIPYRVRVMGNYEQVHKFLTETEQLKRLTHNQSVTINEIKALKTLECLVEFDSFVKKQDAGELQLVSDIPPVNTGRNSLFIY